MSTNLQPIPFSTQPPMNLQFEGRRVRFVGTSDKPEWVAQDVCDVIEIASAADALRDFDDDEKGTVIIHTLGGKQRLLTVYEPGLYRLIFKSRKPEAKRFKKGFSERCFRASGNTGRIRPRKSLLTKLH